MNNYYLYIKSHTEAPDWENEAEANNRKQAIEIFYGWLHGEFDREFIDKNMVREYKSGSFERKTRKAQEDPLTLY